MLNVREYDVIKIKYIHISYICYLLFIIIIIIIIIIIYLNYSKKDFIRLGDQTHIICLKKRTSMSRTQPSIYELDQTHMPIPFNIKWATYHPFNINKICSI
jgi:hypothetical protein